MAVLLDKLTTTVGAGTTTAHAYRGAAPSTGTISGGNVTGTVPGWSGFNQNRQSGVLELSVTAAAAAGTDTLNVFVQYSLDGGQNWQDFAAFAQALGNGGASHSYLQWAANQATSGATVTASDGALTAGTVVKGPIGDLWRVKLVQAGATAQFTVAVYAG